jgi:uncharacterized membrane protein
MSSLPVLGQKGSRQQILPITAPQGDFEINRHQVAKNAKGFYPQISRPRQDADGTWTQINADGKGENILPLTRE